MVRAPMASAGDPRRLGVERRQGRPWLPGLLPGLLPDRACRCRRWCRRRCCRWCRQRGPAAEPEAPPYGHPDADLDGGGLLPVVAWPVRQARGLVGVRRMPAPAAAEWQRWLVSGPTHSDRPGVSSRVVHQVGPPESGRGACRGVPCRGRPRLLSAPPADRGGSGGSGTAMPAMPSGSPCSPAAGSRGSGCPAARGARERPHPACEEVTTPYPADPRASQEENSLSGPRQSFFTPFIRTYTVIFSRCLGEWGLYA